MRSCGMQSDRFASCAGKKWRFLLPGTSEPRLTVLPARACFSVPAPLTRRQQPEHSCHWQLSIGPITAEPCRAKAHPLHPRRSYFAPAGDQPPMRPDGLWWRRRVPPPGPKGLFRCAFIAIAALRRRSEYSVPYRPLEAPRRGNDAFGRGFPADVALLSGLLAGHVDGDVSGLPTGPCLP
jgi:hypothetical protein